MPQHKPQRRTRTRKTKQWNSYYCCSCPHQRYVLFVTVVVVAIVCFAATTFYLLVMVTTTTAITDPLPLLLDDVKLQSSSRKPPLPPPSTPPIPVLGRLYDLDRFVPINNASTTFTFDDFQFIRLHQRRQKQQRKQHVWSVVPEDVNDPKNRLPLPLFMHPSANQSISSNHTKDSSYAVYTNMNICQIICRFDPRSFGYNHFPHFLQQALPCYNIFHYFATATSLPSSSSSSHYYNYMILPDYITSKELFSSYIQSFITVMEGGPYYVQMIYGVNTSIPVHDDCWDDGTSQQQQPQKSSLSPSLTSSAILAIKSFADTGFTHPNRYFLKSNHLQQHPWHAYDDYDGETNNVNNNSNRNHFYYDNYGSIHHLQQSVLGHQYRIGPSSFEYVKYSIETMDEVRPQSQQQQQSLPPSQQGHYYYYSYVVQILLLDRKASSRDFAHSTDIVRELQSHVYMNNSNHTPFNNTHMMMDHEINETSSSFRFNVTYVSSFHQYSLYEQALFIHRADIIYSPHGAQLSNLVYIRPCTVVLEFFPLGYYLQFFQSLVVNAHGISYEGYPTSITKNTTKFTDTAVSIRDKSSRDAVRGTRLYVTSDFFISTLPQLMNDAIECRSNYIKL